MGVADADDAWQAGEPLDNEADLPVLSQGAMKRNVFGSSAAKWQACS